MKRAIWLIVIVFVFFSCAHEEKTFAQSADVPDHEGWTALLKNHVDKEGLVDYKGFLKEKSKLIAYTQLLADNPPADNWTRNEALAYWINAYNAFTVKLIVDNYPLESIKELNPTIAIPMVSTIWNKEWFQIGGEDFSLDRIEHKIIRKQFDEPRIHFAVNCASMSCPVLRAEAFEPERLDEQLDEQARLFINDSFRNNLNASPPRVSKIFSWFTGDFTEDQTLVEFINRFAENKLVSNIRLRYLDYDWSLNEQGDKN